MHTRQAHFELACGRPAVWLPWLGAATAFLRTFNVARFDQRVQKKLAGGG